MDIKAFLYSTFLTLFTNKHRSNLTLIPFKNSPYGVRVVPSTSELNLFVDHVLDSIHKLSTFPKSLPLERVYKHFVRWVCNESVSGIFKTDNGLLWGLSNVRREGDAYIYANREDSVQVVTKLFLSPLYFTFPQYHLIFGTLYETGSVNAVVDSVFVDVQFTVRVNMNTSMPLVLVCEGELDELSMTADQFHFYLSGLKGNRLLYEELFHWLTSHYGSHIQQQLQSLFSTLVETVVKTDDFLCPYLVLCRSCSFHQNDMIS